MKNVVKDLLKSTVISIGMALTIFCLIGHMGIGCAIYTAVAFAVGWFGGSTTLVQGIIIAAIQLAVAFIIWFCFMRYYRKEAKKMNEKIQSMKR